MGVFINLKGKSFGRLTVVRRAKNSRHGLAKFLCKCSCGKTTIVGSCSLRTGNTKSCGCLRKEIVYRRGKAPNRIERKMFYRAKARAKQGKIKFTITLADIVIPEFCPVLGTPIKQVIKGNKEREDSPSLDRKYNNEGYVPGNVFVISYRANRIKNDATAEELEAVISYIRSTQNG